VRNWAGNHRYPTETLHRPASVEQVQELAARAPSLHVLGSRHSFSAIADAAELVSLAPGPDGGLAADVVVDRDAGTVSFSGGLTYGQLAAPLEEAGLALHNLASLPHISVAGAIATATHGSGVGNGNLATAVAAVELVTSSGELVRVARGEPDFHGVVVGLGALGVVTRLTLDVQPAFEVRQRVFDGLPWAVLQDRFAEVLSCGYSVSVFTRLQEDAGEGVDMVWVKSRTDGPASPEGDLFGAREATTPRHPIPGLDTTAATAQRGVPGLWSARLPHFRMEFTPSNGDEIQSEYLVPAAHGAAALEAVRSLAPRLRPLLQVCEIRTVAADRLWLSTAEGRDSVAFHFTWVQDQEAVEEVLAELERVLAPFEPRPHWGKVFCAGAEELVSRYERHGDFVALAQRLDPRGAFRNPWFERRVLGTR
jgi:xylitol oxidase